MIARTSTRRHESLTSSPDRTGSVTVLTLCALLWLLVVVPADALGQSGERSAERQARGARLYNDVCGRCHNARSPAEFSDRDWTTITAHMRTRTHMTRAESRAVAAFLRASNRSQADGATSSPGNPREKNRPPIGELLPEETGDPLSLKALREVRAFLPDSTR